MGRRADVLLVAGNLFREHGYHATSMRDIAKSMGVQGSTLYAHVASKEEMLWEIVSRAANAFLAEAESVAEELPPNERLRALIAGHLRVIYRELPHATVFFQDWKFLSGEYRRRIVDQRDAYEGHFREAIGAGVRLGKYQVDDVKLAAIFVLSALNWTYQWFRPEGKLSVDELADLYNTMIERALGAKEVEHAGPGR